MSAITKFENAQFGSIRALERGGEPWFVGKDVAEALGYANTVDAISKHVDEEDKINVQTSQNALFENLSIPNRGLTIINESGLYSLVFSSKLPGAKDFKRWVTSVVLPSIRRSGGYIATTGDETREELLARAVLVANDTMERLKAENAEKDERIKYLEPKARFADAVGDSEGTCLVGELAKMLRQNGYQIGQNRLFEILRDREYLGKHGQNKNVPTQRSMDMGLFRIKETTVVHADGHTSINRTPKVTGKGQRYFIDRADQLLGLTGGTAQIPGVS